MKDYIDIEDATLREHILEYKGAVGSIDSTIDMLGRMGAYVMRTTGLIDADIDMDALIDNDEEPIKNLPSEQKLGVKIMRELLRDNVVALIEAKNNWKQDLQERIEGAYPIMGDVERVSTYVRLLDNGSHVIRVYPREVDEDETHAGD